MASFLSDINQIYTKDFNYPSVDRLMIRILWVHFLAVALPAILIYAFRPADYYPSPFSWRDLSLPEVTGAILAAFIAVIVPTILKGRLQNHYYYRLIVTAAYMAYSFLVVFVSGSSIEAHFHLFGIWALLTLYYDRRLIWFGFILMILHRLILNYTVPDWLYHYGRNDISLVAHILFALMVAIFTSWIAENGRKALALIFEGNKIMESRIQN